MGLRHRPMAFTEQGVAMLSSVLRSQQAIQVNIQIMRTFTQLRRMAGVHDALRRKIEELEQHYDAQFEAVFAALRQLLEPEDGPPRKIGFTAGRSGSPTASLPRRRFLVSPRRPRNAGNGFRPRSRPCCSATSGAAPAGKRAGCSFCPERSKKDNSSCTAPALPAVSPWRGWWSGTEKKCQGLPVVVASDRAIPAMRTKKPWWPTTTILRAKRAIWGHFCRR